MNFIALQQRNVHSTGHYCFSLYHWGATSPNTPGSSDNADLRRKMHSILSTTI